jgi:hypothetical protein
VSEQRISNSLEKWLCMCCKFLLAFVEDKKIIRMKRKDMYIEIEGGRVATNCPRCGKRNEIVDKKEKGGGSDEL